MISLERFDTHSTLYDNTQEIEDKEDLGNVFDHLLETIGEIEYSDDLNVIAHGKFSIHILPFNKKFIYIRYSEENGERDASRIFEKHEYSKIAKYISLNINKWTTQ